MIITKTSLPRRTFLRGMGVALALPLLDSMVPALTARVRTAANPLSRIGFIYIPHGVILDNWTPKGTGTGFELSRILTPMAPFKDRLTVISGLDGANADKGGSHSTSSAHWLNGTEPKRTEAVDVRAATTIDQLIAKKIGQQNASPSMELATEDVSALVGACDPGYSCTYINTVSWSSPTTPLPMEVNPRVVFHRMFGDGADAEERAALMREDSSILDSVTQEATRLKTRLGLQDRRRVNEYLDNVREIERRIHASSSRQDFFLLDVPASPVGVPESYEEHVSLMFDMMTIAFQTDLTRVFTFMLARELSSKTYPLTGWTEPHHSTSHHQNDPGKIEGHTKINQYHVAQFAQFLEKLQNTPDGDGTLLDHSSFLYGSGMSNGNVHGQERLPLMLIGEKGRFKGGRHIQSAEKTPQANALLGVVRSFDPSITAIGESTDAIDL